MRIRFLAGVVVCLAAMLPLVPASFLAAQSPSSGTLTVRVVGARNAQGSIWIALFRSAEGFPEDSAKAFRIKQLSIDPRTRSAEAVLTGIPPGVWAISAFHDENGNEKLDRNFLGIPKEGYGTSNNPGKKMRAPYFEEAKFSAQPGRSVEIRLIY